jgi:hypothetical protein
MDTAINLSSSTNAINVSTSSQDRSIRPRLEWNDEMHGAMLEGLVEAKAQGLQTDGGFKKDGWMYGVRGAQIHTIQEVTKEKVNNKFDNDKKHWKEWLEHLDVSGWGWNEAKGVPESTKEIMDAYFQKYPKRKPFRDAPPKFKELFDILLGGGLATGRAARTIWNRSTSRVQLESSDKDSESDTTEEIEWEATPAPEVATNLTSRLSSNSQVPVTSSRPLSNSQTSPVITSNSQASPVTSSRPSSNSRASSVTPSLGETRKRAHSNSDQGALGRKKSGGQLALLTQAITASASRIERSQKDNKHVPLQVQAMEEVWNLDWLTEDGKFALHMHLEDSTKAFAFMSLPTDRRQRWVKKEIGSHFVVLDEEENVFN